VILEMDQQTALEVVREFLNVFPEVLPELPSDREAEFTIDVLSDTAPSPRHHIGWHQWS